MEGKCHRYWKFGRKWTITGKCCYQFTKGIWNPLGGWGYEQFVFFQLIIETEVALIIKGICLRLSFHVQIISVSWCSGTNKFLGEGKRRFLKLVFHAHSVSNTVGNTGGWSFADQTKIWDVKKNWRFFQFCFETLCAGFDISWGTWKTVTNNY